MPRRYALTCVFTLSSTIPWMTATAEAHDEGAETQVVHYCVPHSETDLRLEGFKLELELEGGELILPFGAPNVETILDNGPIENRIDLVWVGDGFTEADLSSWAPLAVAGYQELFLYEPFTRYHEYFNVHRVDVISPESGVDNDPVEGIDRDTALDMRFWCSNIERLLCINTTKAAQMAAFAPDVDQIAAVANSSKYGGAGYTGAEIGTYSGFNAAAVDVFIHELGHSLGNLADEYTYGGNGDTYPGGEPGAANASTLDAGQMNGSGLKWDAWLGSNEAGVGPHDCFEGCAYYPQGIYRPSNFSMMRVLAQPFNSPSREGLIFEFYMTVNVIDSFDPPGSTVQANQTITVETVLSDPEATEKSLFVNDFLISTTNESVFELSVLNLEAGDTVSIKVQDTTSMVRNEAMREALMTDTISWEVEAGCSSGFVENCDGSGDCFLASWVGDGYCDGVQQEFGVDLCCYDLDGGDCSLLLCGQLPADLNGDGVVNGEDLAILLSVWGLSTDEYDFDGDGTVGGGDLAFILAYWS